ncbi:MAG: trypsin-like peptidase domain-containing protein, partial [Nitrospira sp.]|nr:trypsin-like peptidase domain-containing protein [Nitrospira sp.]
RAATVAIGSIQQADIRSRNGRVSTKKFFAVVGTGVLFSLHGPGRQESWLVTAKHVFLDPPDHWQPSTLGIVFPQTPGRRVKQGLEIPLQLTEAGRRCWYPHPDKAVDLACLPLSFTMRQPKPGAPSSITWMDIATTAELYEGVPIMVLGYPAAFDIPDSPRAIVRQGIVSWVSPTRPGSEVFLIDSHVFPGNSGGPVFRLPITIDREGHLTAGGAVTLLGIVTQARIQSLPLLAGGNHVDLYLQGKTRSEPLLTPSFLSLGLVEPAYRIKQLLVSATRRHHRRKKSAS